MDVYSHLPALSNNGKQLLYQKEKFPPVSRIASKLAGRPLLCETRSRPIMVVCETVNICTNDCIICAHSKMTRPKTTMSLKTFEKVLHDYSEMGGGYLSLTPKSGEIFLDDFIMDRLKLAKKYPKIRGISVTTNAVPADRFSDEQLRQILGSMCRVQVSVYGLDSEEYRLMTRRDYYQRMVSGAKRIAELSDPAKTQVVFGFRLLKPHKEEEMKRWIVDNFGIDAPFGYTYEYMDWRGAIDKNVPLPYEGMWRKINKGGQGCVNALTSGLILSNGDVSFCSCNDFNGNEEFRLGNIDQTSLSDIYDSEKSRSLWRQLPDVCNSCVSRRPLSELDKYSYIFENPLIFIGA
jgi:radical SAM protein with 4Fe4S-binding SPASM domain